MDATARRGSRGRHRGTTCRRCARRARGDRPCRCAASDVRWTHAGRGQLDSIEVGWRVDLEVRGPEPLAEGGCELLRLIGTKRLVLPSPAPPRAPARHAPTIGGADTVQPMARSHYEVLGVPRERRRRRAAAGLSRAGPELHPDRYIDAGPTQRSEAERSMQEVNEAWRVLSDPGRRRRYDAELDPVTTARARWATDDERFVSRPGRHHARADRAPRTGRAGDPRAAVDHPHRGPVRHLRVHRVRGDGQPGDDTAGPAPASVVASPSPTARPCSPPHAERRARVPSSRRSVSRSRARTARSGCNRRRDRSPTAWRSHDEGGRHRPCRAHRARCRDESSRGTGTSSVSRCCDWRSGGAARCCSSRCA